MPVGVGAKTTAGTIKNNRDKDRISTQHNNSNSQNSRTHESEEGPCEGGRSGGDSGEKRLTMLLVRAVERGRGDAKGRGEARERR